MDFLDHRKQLKKIVTQIAGERLLKKLSRYPINTSIAMLDQSMENGWQGVFEIKGHNGKTGPAPGAAKKELEKQGYVIRE